MDSRDFMKEVAARAGDHVSQSESEEEDITPPPKPSKRRTGARPSKSTDQAQSTASKVTKRPQKPLPSRARSSYDTRPQKRKRRDWSDEEENLSDPQSQHVHAPRLPAQIVPQQHRPRPSAFSQMADPHMSYPQNLPRIDLANPPRRSVALSSRPSTAASQRLPKIGLENPPRHSVAPSSRPPATAASTSRPTRLTASLPLQRAETYAHRHRAPPAVRREHAQALTVVPEERLPYTKNNAHGSHPQADYGHMQDGEGPSTSRRLNAHQPQASPTSSSWVPAADVDAILDGRNHRQPRYIRRYLSPFTPSEAAVLDPSVNADAAAYATDHAEYSNDEYELDGGFYEDRHHGQGFGW